MLAWRSSGLLCWRQKETDRALCMVNSFKTVDRVYRDLPINRRTVNVVKKSWMLITGSNTET